MRIHIQIDVSSHLNPSRLKTPSPGPAHKDFRTEHGFRSGSLDLNNCPGPPTQATTVPDCGPLTTLCKKSQFDSAVLQNAESADPSQTDLAIPDVTYQRNPVRNSDLRSTLSTFKFGSH